MSKKNTLTFWQQLHTFSQRVSDAKVAIVVVGGTIISVALGFANFYFNYKLAPLYAKADNNSARISNLEEALPVVIDNIQTISDFINEPRVKVLRTNLSSRQNLVNDSK